MRRLLTSPEATHALGVALGRAARPGTVIALEGDLGAGKTALARGIGAGLAVPTRVTSPTFVLVQAHLGGRLPLWHADLYRLSDPDELVQLGMDDALEGDGVVVVEWADRFSDWLPSDHLHVLLEHATGGRWVTLTARGPRHGHLEAAGG